MCVLSAGVTLVVSDWDLGALTLMLVLPNLISAHKSAHTDRVGVLIWLVNVTAHLPFFVTQNLDTLDRFYLS